MSSPTYMAYTLGERISKLESQIATSQSAANATLMLLSSISRSTETFNGLAALKAIPANQLQVERMYFLRGYVEHDFTEGAESRDAGEGAFILIDNLNSIVADDGIFVTPNNALEAGIPYAKFVRILLPGQKPCPEMFGGFPDGVVSSNGYTSATADRTTLAFRNLLQVYGSIHFHGPGIYGLKHGAVLYDNDGPNPIVDKPIEITANASVEIALVNATLTVKGGESSASDVGLPWWTDSSSWATDALLRYDCHTALESFTVTGVVLSGGVCTLSITGDRGFRIGDKIKLTKISGDDRYFDAYNYFTLTDVSVTGNLVKFTYPYSVPIGSFSGTLTKTLVRTPSGCRIDFGGAKIHMNGSKRLSKYSATTGIIQLPSRVIDITGYNHEICNFTVDGLGVSRGVVGGSAGPEMWAITCSIPFTTPRHWPLWYATSSWTYPASGESVTVTVHSTNLMFVGLVLFVQHSTGAGFVRVKSLPAWNQVELEHHLAPAGSVANSQSHPTIATTDAIIMPLRDGFRYFDGPNIHDVHFEGGLGLQKTSDWGGGGTPPGGYYPEASLISAAGQSQRGNMYRNTHIHAITVNRFPMLANNVNACQQRPIHAITLAGNVNPLVERCLLTDMCGSFIYCDAWITLGALIKDCTTYRSHSAIYLTTGEYGFDASLSDPGGLPVVTPWLDFKFRNCRFNDSKTTYDDTGVIKTIGSSILVYKSGNPLPAYGQPAWLESFDMDSCVLECNKLLFVIDVEGPYAMYKWSVTYNEFELTYTDDVIEVDQNQIFARKAWPIADCRYFIMHGNRRRRGSFSGEAAFYPAIPVWNYATPGAERLTYGQQPVMADGTYTIVEAADADSRFWIMRRTKLDAPTYTATGVSELPAVRKFIIPASLGAGHTIVLPKTAAGGLLNQLPAERTAGVQTAWYAPTGTQVSFFNNSANPVTLAVVGPGAWPDLQTVATVPANDFVELLAMDTYTNGWVDAHK